MSQLLRQLLTDDLDSDRMEPLRAAGTVSVPMDGSGRSDEPASGPTTRTTRSQLKCWSCRIQFEDKVEYNNHKYRHRRDKIPEGQRLYCNFPGCEFVTRTNNHLEYHVKTHKSEKDFICNICGYSCIVSSMLISHEKSHTDERPFKCERCSFATKYRSALNKHMKEKHGIIRVKSKTRARGQAQNNQQDTDGDTVDRNFANDGVRPNSSHAPYGQPFSSPQPSSPSTSSSALSSPPTPCPFTFGIRAPFPAHYNPTIPSFLPSFQSPLTPTSPSTSQKMLASLFPLLFPHLTPPPAHTKPAESPSCLNSILPSPPPAHTNPIPKHQGLDWILHQLPPSTPPDLALNDKVQVIQRFQHIIDKLIAEIESLRKDQLHEFD